MARRLHLILFIILICLLAIVLTTEGRIRKTAQREASYVEKAETGVTAADLLIPLIIAGAEKDGHGRALSPRRRKALESENIVVDTLNLAHWLRRRAPLKTVELCDIISAIDETAPTLRQKYSGRIIYVTKDRETYVEKEKAERVRALYQAASRRNGVYINVVEKLQTPEVLPTDSPATKPHAALGRDDFYLIMLAWKLNCSVLSRDRFRDLKDMKSGHLDKFHVYSYSPVKDLPDRDYVNPVAAEFARMRRPTTVDYADVFPHM